MIKCLFRQPRFPLICDVHGVLIGAETPEQFEAQVAALELPAGELLPLVDAAGEGWVFHTDEMVVSPLTLKKRWTKKEIISMYNRSETARRLGTEYSTRSLSSKRLDRIVAEVAALIASAHPPIDADQQ